ncbi:META domain-containing protein [Microbulbifer sp.]|uniref:META domain-containing protein n=1 Tax=Microbulbifer sp. TaxID=1908541 RepID=UPI003F333E64
MLPARRPLIPLAAVALLILGGCGQLSEAELAEAAAEEGSICEHQWLLESLSVDGREHRRHLLWRKFWRERPYFTCDKLGYVRGSAGSNPYLGRFSLSDGGELSWSQPPTISRMSDIRESSELEKDYLKALPRTDSAQVEGDSLILRSDSDKTRLEFRRAGSVE